MAGRCPRCTYTISHYESSLFSYCLGCGLDLKNQPEDELGEDEAGTSAAPSSSNLVSQPHLTPQKKASRWSRLSSEQKAKTINRETQRRREKASEMTEEDLAKKKEVIKEHQRENFRKRQENMTPEQREAYRKRRNEAYRVAQDRKKRGLEPRPRGRPRKHVSPAQSRPASPTRDPSDPGRESQSGDFIIRFGDDECQSTSEQLPSFPVSDDEFQSDSTNASGEQTDRERTVTRGDDFMMIPYDSSDLSDSEQEQSPERTRHEQNTRYGRHAGRDRGRGSGRGSRH